MLRLKYFIIDNILNQIRRYIGINIPTISIYKQEFIYCSENIKQILKDEDVKDLTFSELKQISPYDYYRLIGHNIRLLIQNPDYKFIDLNI